MSYETSKFKLDTPPIHDLLRGIDWTFMQREKAPAIEAIHPYPAKFIGEIPRALIETFPVPEGSAIFDPFCGSGTSLLEAQRAGLPSIGVDLNPIACLISRVKTSPTPERLVEAAAEIVEGARAIKEVEPSGIPNVDHWFKSEIQLAVGALAQTMSSSEYILFEDHLRLALSSILVRVSNQDSDTRYAAVEKNITYSDVFSLFLSSVQKLDRSLNERNWDLPEALVIEGNTLEIDPSEIKKEVGLIVTSPPYPNAYEYWLYHKYRMWWLGFDPIAVKEQEIGARAHFFKKNHHTAEHFVDQMQKTFELISKVLVKNGFVCFVVGRSKIHGEIVDNGNIISDVAKNIGLEEIVRIERPIHSQRKSFNLSHANIKTESLLVFRKS